MAERAVLLLPLRNTGPPSSPSSKTAALGLRECHCVCATSTVSPEGRNAVGFSGLHLGLMYPEHPNMPEHIKKQLEEQIRELERELTQELPAEIKKAAALGDLSENAEYHMAKQRQVFVNARLGQLKKRMAELALVNLANIPKDRIAFGSTVLVYDTTKDEKIEYKLVTSEESDVNKGLISTTSPIGRGLVGKQVGDIAVIVTPNGKRELEILRLTTIHGEEE
jgi:transcription elongation factor GreA